MWLMRKLLLVIIIFGTVLGLSLAYVDLSHPSYRGYPREEGKNTKGSDFSYQVGECSQDKFRSLNTSSVSVIDYETIGNSLQVDQQLNYICCADIELRKEVVGNTIKIYERNRGGMCECLCTYPIDFSVKGLRSGDYTLRIYGVEYEKYEHDYTLLNEIKFQVD